MRRITFLSEFQVLTILPQFLLPQPDTLWAKTYGGTSSDVGSSVTETADGGYIIAGYTWSYGAGMSDIYLIGVKANGDLLWTRTCGGENADWAYSLAPVGEEGYIVAGEMRSYGSDQSDVYLLRFQNPGMETLP